MIGLLNKNKVPQETPQDQTTPQTQETTEQQQVTESILLDLSLFKNDYIDILYEDAVTTADIEREEKQQSGRRIEVNKDENSMFKQTMNNVKVITEYVKICYSVNSKIMSILDDAYDKSIKFCDKVASYTPKQTKDNKGV